MFFSQTGIAGTNRNGVFLFNAASGGLPGREVTFAKIAKQQGYETALIGALQLSLISHVAECDSFKVLASHLTHLLICSALKVFNCDHTVTVCFQEIIIF